MAHVCHTLLPPCSPVPSEILVIRQDGLVRNVHPLFTDCPLCTSVQCRSAALTVLCTMLEGTRPYLAAADDRLHSCGLTFTPFSSRLGGVLRELHHRLLLALGVEAQPVVLTRAVRCLAILTSSTPYHQLSSGYATRVLSALYPLSEHRGTHYMR